MTKLHLRRSSALLASASILVLGAASASLADFELGGLGYLPGGSSAGADGASADGSVVVGTSNTASGLFAYRWTQSGGMINLGDLPGGTTTSQAHGVSSDGLVVVGSSHSTGGTEAFRWTQSTGMIGLGDLAGGLYVSNAYDVNGDGSVIVGRSISANGAEAFRWTQSGGMVGLGDLAGGTFSSRAKGVSNDGSVVAGYANSAAGTEAFLWTEASGMVGLGDMAGGSYGSYATDLSDDGLVVVGYGFSTLGEEAFRWNESDGMVGLGVLPGDLGSYALAVNSEGSVIVGGSDGIGTETAFRWLAGTGEGSGMQSIAALLTGDGVDIGTWQLASADAVSDDGNVIVGYGRNPLGQPEPWRAVIGVGLVSIEDFSTSLAAMSEALYSAQGSARRDIENIMNVARHYTGGPGSDDARGANLWGHVGQHSFGTLSGESDALSGAFGVSGRGGDDLRAGLGVHFGKTDFELAGGVGQSDRSSFGVDAFGAYEPAASPLRLYAGIIANWSDDDLMRGYENGVEPVISQGQRDGTSWGGTLQLGWEHAVGGKSSLMPFVSYEATKVELDAYTETNGPFPATFDKVDETAQIGRLGVEATTEVGEAVLWGSAAWAHQFEDELPAVTGSIAAFSSDFAFAGANLEQDRAEFKVGLAMAVNDKSRLNTSVNVSSDFDNDPEIGVTVGFNMSF